MHFARKESGRFYLHPVDREFAFGLIPLEELTAKTAKSAKKDLKKSLRPSRALRLESFSQHDLLSHAADYFAQARKPRAEWKKLDDLAAQLAEFDLRCAAGDYDTAANVLLEIDFDYLLLWGHYRLMIELHMRLKDKIIVRDLHMGILNGLGLANLFIGRVKEAITYYESGLLTARGEKDRSWEGALLGNLGSAYYSLGDIHKNIDAIEQALIIEREIGERENEGRLLGNLGNLYADLGDAHKAIEFHEQAINLAQEIGDRKGEGSRISNIGLVYADLGDVSKAIEFYEQAISIAQEIGDRMSEASVLGNIGLALLSMKEYEKAKRKFIQSIQIADEISYPIVLSEEHLGLAQAYLFQNDLVNARDTIEAALQYDVPQYNHNASALHGIIVLRQGDASAARQSFTRASAQADEILAKTAEYYSALDAKGLALCGLLLTKDLTGLTESHPDGKGSDGDLSGLLTQAIETFRKARKIAPHAGVVKSVLRLFDELVKCDEEGILKDVREVIAPTVTP